MSCNCNNQIINSTIQFVVGTTENITLEFDEDISNFDSGKLTIRKDYNSEPILNKTVSITDAHIIQVELNTTDTGLFTDFERNKNSAQYIWGFDVIDSNSGVVINVFPQTGVPAPYCIVYKHVVNEE